MAEYIEREAFIEILKKTKKDCERYADKVVCDFAIQIANLMRTDDDVQKVVRCKDCNYLYKATVNKKGFLVCPVSGMEITDNDFCSYGVKKE